MHFVVFWHGIYAFFFAPFNNLTTSVFEVCRFLQISSIVAPD